MSRTVFEHLDIYDRRERLVVGWADCALAPLRWPLSLVRRRRTGQAPRRILLLRLERIGDLLMSLGAIRSVRELAPHAVIDLVVGSWNAALAQTIAGIDRVEVLDLPWLARHESSHSLSRLAARAWRWRRQHYDLAINFEGDIRSHLLMAGSLARRRVGFDMAGGGPVLTDRVAHDARRHTALNALALVERAFDVGPGTLPGPLQPRGRALWRLDLPADAKAQARAELDRLGVPRDGRPLVAVHAPGGREIKQWPPARFAEVAARLAAETGARILLTGGSSDRALVNEVAGAIGPGVSTFVLDGDLPLPVVAAVLAECALVVTGDTGPMHLAAATETPVVGIFGPSDPARYAPLGARSRVVRIDLWCSPCNRIRKPPERCVGHTPDCLEGVTVSHVLAAARDLLGNARAAVLGKS
jgi:lipopolysaccharide heptosyltransferase II